MRWKGRAKRAPPNLRNAPDFTETELTKDSAGFRGFRGKIERLVLVLDAPAATRCWTANDPEWNAERPTLKNAVEPGSPTQDQKQAIDSQ